MYFNEQASDIENAAFEIGEFISKWGRVQVTQTKEKYGTARVYCTFGVHSLHSLLYPRRIYKHQKWPDWLWNLDCFYLATAISFLSNTLRLHNYQTFIYKLGYKRSIKKWPHIKNNILQGADYSEFLEDLWK